MEHSWSEIRSEIMIKQYPASLFLWHKVAYNRTFPCMEATYPRGLWMRQSGSLWHKRAGIATSWKYFSSLKLSTNESTISTLPTNESAPLCWPDQMCWCCNFSSTPAALLLRQLFVPLIGLLKSSVTNENLLIFIKQISISSYSMIVYWDRSNIHPR